MPPTASVAVAHRLTDWPCRLDWSDSVGKLIGLVTVQVKYWLALAVPSMAVTSTK